MYMKKTRSSLIGERFGNLTVIEFDHTDGHYNTCWVCECDCGKRIIVSRCNLVTGNTKSCGCYGRERTRQANITHGLTKTRLYKIWTNMHTRCENKNSTAYSRYGGRGIDVCEDWGNFENFKFWADDSGYTANLTLDRVDNDKGYYPENCRWVDYRTQANNTRRNRRVEYNGVSHTIAEWSRIFNVDYEILLRRVNRNDMCNFIEYFNESNDVQDTLMEAIK